MKTKVMWILVVFLCLGVGLLEDNQSEAQEKNPNGARSRLCIKEVCNGCMSAPACVNAQVGQKCSLSGHTGRCIQLKTCGTFKACCGCELGGKVYIDDNQCFSKETTDRGERPSWVRFFIGTDGMGVVKCNGCSTAGGCTSLWISGGSSASCKASPAPGNKFLYWTASGNYAGENPSIRFGKKGAILKGHFAPK